MIKTGLGAEKNIPWEYHLNGLELVNALQIQGTYIAVLESTPQSTSVFCFHPSLPSEQPFLLVVGNEVTGVDPEIRAMADAVLSIPMEGAKSSLNVAVAFGIAVYTIQESIR
jgi:tRNA G18 (ribose-2'-O)-methylase SpoU